MPSPKFQAVMARVPEEVLVKLMGTPAQTRVLLKLKFAEGHPPPAVVCLITEGMVSANVGEAFSVELKVSARSEIKKNWYFIEIV